MPLASRVAVISDVHANWHALEAVLEAAADPALPDAAYLDLDVRFHREVAASAENRVLMVPLFALHAIVQPRLNQAISPLVVRSEIDAEHGAIVAAIRGRDAAAASAAVDAHIDHLERLYRRVGVL